jgi:hypothetical protein
MSQVLTKSVAIVLALHVAMALWAQTLITVAA